MSDPGAWDRLFCGGPAPEHLILPQDLADSIRAAACRAYPHEGCGLLVGQGARVTRVVDSPNIAERGHDRFEVDPRVLLSLMKSLRGTPERMIGHWHSHPDHPAAPSATDLSRAWEPGLVWLICGVSGGAETELAAWRLAADGSGFVPVELATGDVSEG